MIDMNTMSVREVYEYIHVEQNKAKAPSLLLEDFLYFLNKAINNYANIKYNTFNLNQQYTDDLKELVRTYEVSSPKLKDGNNVLMQNNSDPLTQIADITVPVEGKDVDFAVVSLKLPKDYYHLLNCVIKYGKTEVVSNNRYEIYTIKTRSPYRVRRVTNESLAMTLNNYYYRPRPNNPYFILNNEVDSVEGTKINSVINIYIGKLPKTNKVDKVAISYLMMPKKMTLTEDELYEVEDNSMLMEFPRYICYEIINILTGLVMINTGNPNVSNVLGFNKTIQPIGLEQQQIPPLTDVDSSTQDPSGQE